MFPLWGSGAHFEYLGGLAPDMTRMGMQGFILCIIIWVGGWVVQRPNLWRHPFAPNKLFQGNAGGAESREEEERRAQWLTGGRQYPEVAADRGLLNALAVSSGMHERWTYAVPPRHN